MKAQDRRLKWIRKRVRQIATHKNRPKKNAHHRGHEKDEYISRQSNRLCIKTERMWFWPSGSMPVSGCFIKGFCLAHFNRPSVWYIRLLNHRRFHVAWDLLVTHRKNTWALFLEEPTCDSTFLIKGLICNQNSSYWHSTTTPEVARLCLLLVLHKALLSPPHLLLPIKSFS